MKSLLIVCLLVFGSGLLAQPTFEWVNGNIGNDNVFCYDLSLDDTGNSVVVGSFRGTADFDPGAGLLNLTSAGNYDIFVQKLDNSGNLLWAFNLGWTDYDEAIAVCQDSNGNIYVTGRFRSAFVDFDPGAGVTSLAPVGNFDLFVLKLDTNGNFIWVKSIGSSESNGPNSIAYDPSGNIVIGVDLVGTNLDFDPGPGVFNLTSSGSTNGAALKLDLSGDFIWAKHIAGGDIVFLHELVVDAASNVILTGSFNTNIDVDPSVATDSRSTNGISDMYVIKLNSNGDYTWGHTMGSTGGDELNTVDVFPNGDVVVGGKFRDNMDIDPGAGVVNLIHSAGVTSSDAVVLKLDAAGNYVWHNQVVGSTTKSCEKIRVGSSGNVYASGHCGSSSVINFGGYLVNAAGTQAVYLHGINFSGATIYAESIGGSGAVVRSYGYELDPSEAIYTSGIYVNSSSVDFDPGTGVVNLNFVSGSEGFVLKLLQCSNSTSTISPIECFSYTSPSGNYTWTSSGSYEDTITNVAGCDSIISINLTIGDFISPVADAGSLTTLTAQCAITSFTAPTATDNCAGSVTGTTSTTLPITASTTITWTYDDGNGNTSTQTQDVVINDNTAPVADAGSLTTLSAQCEVTSLTAPTATDNCVGAVTGTHSATLPITSTTTITWTYDDGNGNTSTQTQDVIIDDVTAPVADIASLSDVTAQCEVTSLTAPTATDNCVGAVTGTHNATLPITSTTTITWTYDDGNGNTSTQTQEVIIDDVTAPVADAGSLSDLTDECEITSLTAPTATDNCAGSITGTHSVTLPITSTTTITWTYDDGNGNTSTQTQEVIIDDVTAPVADVASLTDVTADCEVTSLTAPTATDNCAGSITGTHNASLPITAQGTTTVTWTYDDGNGNTSTQTQDVVITDVTAPAADLANLADINSECEVTPTAPAATDNCTGAVTGTPDVSFPIAASGTTTVTWTYDDGNGNTSTQTQDVVITPIDNGVTVVDDITLSADATGYTYQWVDCEDNNAPIAGETNQSFEATSNGSYAVIIDNGDCSVTSSCFDITTVGLNNNELIEINVYPNPTSGIVNIESSIEIESIELVNALGQHIAVYSGDQKTIQITTAPGVYFLKIITQGQEKIVQLIKQ